MIPEEYLEFAERLARKAGVIMLHYFDSSLDIRVKADKTIVTVADEEINRMVIAEVAKAYPDHSVSGEEESMEKNSEYVWVCDPIDGTIPFSKGIPVSMFSLALVRSGEAIVGVAYDPQTERLYSAAKGKGAFMNGQSMKVSSRKLERHSVVNMEWWPGAEFDIEPQLHELSLQTEAYVVKIGCTVNAACLVASGRIEAAVFPGTVNKNMDIAAAKILIEEAGGKVTDLFGNEQRYDRSIKGAIMSNGVVHDELVRRLEFK